MLVEEVFVLVDGLLAVDELVVVVALELVAVCTVDPSAVVNASVVLADEVVAVVDGLLRALVVVCMVDS